MEGLKGNAHTGVGVEKIKMTKKKGQKSMVMKRKRIGGKLR